MNLETRGDESAHRAYAVSSCLTAGPACLRDALDSDPASSQPVPGGVMAGQRDKEEIGGIGGVKYRLLRWGQTWFGTENTYQRAAAVTEGFYQPRTLFCSIYPPVYYQQLAGASNSQT